MREVDAQQVRVSSGFWQPRLEMNAHRAIWHQWEQLEQSGSIDNFRLLAEDKPGFREGWFFAGSDAFKWLDAAARVYASYPSRQLAERMNAFIALLGAAQADDGYLYTYNQIHFPEVRWTNLQIEHELYCHGHLIEAGISHYKATGQRHMLEIAERAADLLVRDFLGAGPKRTPGHQEIELALIQLYRVTKKAHYLALAEQFVEQRGRIRPFGPLIFRQNQSVGRRSKLVQERRAAYLAEHPEHAAFSLPAGNRAKKPRGIQLRYLFSALTGNYFQQHRPVREQTVPVGHSVRFAYLETAVAMLFREGGDESLLPALEAAWEHMVNRRMYVTGGIGSLPAIEGFGRDYELDPEVAYAETCAALGCMFWNWEMTLITRQAKYADLFEWQLYNAASVGMGLTGDAYLYNNPLACRGGVTRRGWYQVPCCPSNLSRTWAALGQYLYSSQAGELWVHQYVSSETTVDLGTPVRIAAESDLPWRGRVRITLSPASPAEFTLNLRIPSWAEGYSLQVNGQALETVPRPPDSSGLEQPASGHAPQRAYYLPIPRTWSPGDVVEIGFALPIVARRAHRKVKSARGRVALTRGPLVYCLESVDNPGLDLFDTEIELASLTAEFDANLLGGIWVLSGKTAQGEAVTAIPYYSWANRGESQMVVWVRSP
ncbi:MAG: glycoside hydrolase family 127 protein [Anaerolineae bacterium]